MAALFFVGFQTCGPLCLHQPSGGTVLNAALLKAKPGLFGLLTIGDGGWQFIHGLFDTSHALTLSRSVALAGVAMDAHARSISGYAFLHRIVGLPAVDSAGQAISLNQQ
jgi:hypothetical protein